jgi:glycosyltransferase involved in cell wall biosynthesis
MAIPEKKELTVVIPCLNEERSIRQVVREVSAEFSRAGMSGSVEILVVDNGSTDASAALAEAAGARVVVESRRGYGRALRTGVAEARGNYAVFIDADGEHPPALSLALYLAVLRAGAEVGVASRFSGEIAHGAMPLSHRYVGTPALTFLINHWFGGKLTDCMSGLRCVRRDWFLRQEFRQDGMAFASELLIQALREGSEVVEIPGGMRRGPEGRKSHLRTWRDGWTHLRLICLEKLGLLPSSSGTLTQPAKCPGGIPDMKGDGVKLWPRA